MKADSGGNTVVHLDERQRRDGEIMRLEVKRQRVVGNKGMLVLSCYLATFLIYFEYPFMVPLWGNGDGVDNNKLKAF